MIAFLVLSGGAFLQLALVVIVGVTALEWLKERKARLAYLLVTIATILGAVWGGAMIGVGIYHTYMELPPSLPK